MLKNKKQLLVTSGIIVLLIILFLLFNEINKIMKKSNANIVMIADETVLVENDKNFGINNTKNLQKLVDEVHNNGGGTIIIPEGTYYFTVDIDDSSHYDWGGHYAIFCKDNVLIEGAGMDKTILKPYGEFPHGIDMFYYRDYNYQTYLINADFKKFTIDGSEGKTTDNKFNARGKGFMLDPVKDCDWEKVKVMNTDGTGFGMDLPINCTITDCIAIGNGKAATEEDAGASGFGIGTGLSENESMYIKNCLSIGNRKFGFFFEHQGRFNPKIFNKKVANGKNVGTDIKGFLVENSIARGNMYDFGGEKANDVTYKNCTSQNSLPTDPNPLKNSNTAAFYLGLNSRRINFVDNSVEQKYSDVDENSSKAVYWALNNGIIDGGGKKTNFNPNDSLKNSAAILLIWRLAGRPGEVLIGYGDAGTLKTNYNDVGSCQWDQCDGSVYWFIDSVVWGINEGILDNTGNFGALENCSNKEFIYWLWKYSGSPIVAIENGFIENESITSKYVDALNWALNLGLIDDTFVTKNEYKRIDAINLLYNYYKIENDVQYTIKFDANDGSGETNSVELDSNNPKLPINKFTKVGYIFKEWNTKPDGTGKIYKDEQEVSIDNNMTLYAQWEPITYTIKFEANGGTGIMEGQTFIYDEESNLSPNKFLKEKYIFKEWNTKSDGTGISYQDKESIINLSNNANDVINLYAIWNKLPIITNNSINYEGIYDGLEHTININVDIENYDIKYSINNEEYNLTEIPKFKEVGEHTIYYKITKEGYDDLFGSNKVKIYGIKEFDSTLKIKDNIIVTKNNSFTNIIDKIKIYSITTKYDHYDKNNSLIDTDIIKTNDSININLNNTKDYKYLISIIGDINSDAKISSADYVKIRKHIMQAEIIKDDVYFYAADVNSDNKISSADYVKIRKYIMNGDSL